MSDSASRSAQRSRDPLKSGIDSGFERVIAGLSDVDAYLVNRIAINDRTARVSIIPPANV